MRLLRSAAAAAALSAVHPAQVLPFRSFGLREGVPHERVSDLFEDSRGFLWIGTWDGLARFDGATFATYGTREGLTSTVASALAEDEHGDLWFGAHTAGLGRIRFASAANLARRAEIFAVGAEPAANAIEALVFQGGHAWIASADGLWRMELDERGQPVFTSCWAAPWPFNVQAVVRRGARAWFLSAHERIELGDDFQLGPGPGTDPGFDVLAQPAPDGRVLLCTAEGPVEFVPPDRYEPLALAMLPGVRIKATAIAADGTRWIGTTDGLLRMDADGLEHFGREAGLPSERISTLLLDHSGKLWIGTHDGGLCVLAAASPESYLAHGEHVSLSRLARASGGGLFAAGLGLYAVGDAGLELVPGSSDPPIARTDGFFLCDGDGAFWLGCASGVFRVPGPELDLGRLEGPLLPGPVAGAFHEDRRGDLWVSAGPHTVYVRRAGSAFERVLDWPVADDPVREVHVDAADRAWLVGWHRLWRREGERLTEIRLDGQAPQVRAMLADASGRLWLGLRHGGLAWTAEPGAEAPSFTHLRTTDGLPSDTVWALAEGPDGALWLGTGRGLARYTGASGALATWTEADGLGGGAVFDVLCTDDGSVWAATSGGVARVDPGSPPAPLEPPTVFVAGFEAGGEVRALPEAGTADLTGLVLAPEEDGVVVRFGGVDLLHGADLRFQTRLAGGEWSSPSAERSLHLARLEPGDYALEIRSLARSGLASETSARVEFRLLAPVWRRPWFVALAALALLLGLWGIHRARLARIVGLQRVRDQIAGDLHDEVGSGLAQISILSEVARREAAPAVAARLGEVAELARATRASMNDLVWAIHPEKDRLGELVARMQGATEQVLEPAGVECSFRAPDAEELARIALGPEARRQILLFFKEALTNAARHARAGNVRVVLTLAGKELTLAVEDDGCGFDPRASANGHGLASLRRRAERLGGRLDLDSAPGHGTRVGLVVPLA